MNREEKLEWYEEERKRIERKIKGKSLSHYDLLRIRNYKLRLLTKENEESRIKKITEKAFKLAKSDKTIKEAVSILQKGLDGVGIPIASAILSMRYPNNYCIIDKNVIRELVKKGIIKRGKFKDYLNSSEIYKEYLLLMRKEAKKNGVKRVADYEFSLFKKSFKR